MAKKSLGYVELEWTCPSCGHRNKGTVTKCEQCGTPQPEDVEFEQPVQEAIVQDEALEARAAAGPDIHCPYCGTRNPATATECRQCGGDLTGAEARETGEVLGAHRKEKAPDVTCGYCGTENPATARRCKNCGAALQKPVPKAAAAAPTPRPAARSGGSNQWLIIGVAVVVLACVALAFLFFARTEEVTGVVESVSWERQIVILGPAEVEHEDWEDELPAGADVGMCREEYRYTTDEFVAGAEEVCGTPYTVDTGTGVGEVVQDCSYEVYDTFCEYRVVELRPVDTLVLTGEDLAPAWPALNLAAEQKAGEYSEDYTVVFATDDGTVTYGTSSAESFARFRPGSEWILELNTLGGVVGVEPAN